jgi:hypothetical protein
MSCSNEKTILLIKEYKNQSSSVAAWLSETVLRGRGPGASGFESHRRGRIFSKEETSAGPRMCVYVYQGLTVGWWKEERHSSDTTARSAGFESQGGWASHGCCVLLYSCCVVQKKEKEEERVGVGGRGKYYAGQKILAVIVCQFKKQNCNPYFIVIMITVLIMNVIFWVVNFKTQNYFVISTTQNVYLRLSIQI